MMRTFFLPACECECECVCVCVCGVSALTSPVRDGADCPKDWLLMRTRLFVSPPAAASPPGAPGPPCQASWLTPVCRLQDRGSNCFPANGEGKKE